MKPVIKCEIDYFPLSIHLSQIYCGFELLAQSNIIELKINKKKQIPVYPMMNVLVNEKYKVIYDISDGYNWVTGNLEENIHFIKNEINADFIFKRSWRPDFQTHLTTGQSFPLGLNYPVQPKFITSFSTRKLVKKVLSPSRIVSSLLKIKLEDFFVEDFEFFPVMFPQNKILFLARLWDPAEITHPQNAHLADERNEINKSRINCIRICKKEFPKIFIGGLLENTFTKKYAPDLIMPYQMTNKKEYLNTMKSSNICIATTGLHGSITWKFGEYVAASRAIVSEPLNYNLPGNFEENENYFTFTDADSLVDKINHLLGNPELIYETMNNNYLYYSNYVRPDKLVFNTLFTVLKETAGLRLDAEN